MPIKPSPRVLCVDDDEDFREVLSTLLRVSRIEARAVATAAQALSLIQAERFDLYLLDSRLPDLDGFELCRRLRDFDPETPILFFSGAAYEADKERGIEAGANAYVTKPDVEGLLGSIMRFVFHGESAADDEETPGSDSAMCASIQTKTDSARLNNAAVFPMSMMVATISPEPAEGTTTAPWSGRAAGRRLLCRRYNEEKLDRSVSSN